MAIVFLLLGLIVFAAIGVPLAFAIGASCISYLAIDTPMFLSMMPQRIWNGRAYEHRRHYQAHH